MSANKEKLLLAGASLPITESVAAMLHGGPIGAIVALGVSGLVYALADEVESRGGELPLPRSTRTEQEPRQPGQHGRFYKMFNGKSVREAEEESPENTSETEDHSLFTAKLRADDTGGIERLTIDEIVADTEPNSFKIWIGRSLTQDGNPAVQIKFYKQHFRFIGASQRGKSSMVAAFLEIVTRTHDKQHVQLILLDMENQTSHLFAGLPHVIKMRTQSGETIKMHARSEEQVLQYLVYAVVLMKRRYKIAQRDGIAALKKLPVILVYIEEFLRLKAYFKARLKTAQDKAQAESDYATFMYCINELAGRGLKSRMQLLLAAQVEFADEDFREAMANVSCGFSFCVKREAAMAAGFTNAELLTRNLKENKVGQAVVECPDCNDLVLAPEYDLEARLEAWQEENEERDESETNQLEDDFTMDQTQKIKLAFVEKQKQGDGELEKAMAAYLAGATTLDAMAAAMGYDTQHQARKIMPRVKAEIEKQKTAING